MLDSRANLTGRLDKLRLTVGTEIETVPRDVEEDYAQDQPRA